MTNKTADTLGKELQEFWKLIPHFANDGAAYEKLLELLKSRAAEARREALLEARKCSN